MRWLTRLRDRLVVRRSGVLSRVQQHFFMEIDHEIIFIVILFLLLILDLEGLLSVSGYIMRRDMD